MTETMIIVGAGMAGLSTGCYAQMNGFKSEIYESNRVPGGLCAAWTRKGYTFDISMHILAGSKDGPFRKMWDELGVTRNQEFFYHRKVVTVEGLEKRLEFCLDRDRLEKQMLAISPGDAGLIKEFLKVFFGPGVMDLASLDPPELVGIAGRLKMILKVLPMVGVFKKFGNMTLQEFVDRCQDPFLAVALRSVVDTPGWPMPDFPMVAMAGFARAGGEAGYPLGGSFRVAQKIADRYRSLGGQIHFNSRVVDILIENDGAVGIRLEDGSEHRADTVVWAGDGHHLIYDILGGKYLDSAIRDMYEKWQPVKPMVHVCFGVNLDLSGEPKQMVYEVEKPITIAGQDFKWLSIVNHAFDKSTSPPGKSALEVWYATDYGYWEELHRDRPRYEAEKKRIAEETAAALETRWPGFRSKIEVVDVPTPMTYVRYTGNWQGSVDGWYITPDNMREQKMKRSLPGLSQLYMVGQWTAPFTGTVGAALSGRQLVQILCKKARRPFLTEMPGSRQVN
ncbi:MAG: NAD(P)/FAD-dependent oxidoreductase [Candidatus Aminicenantes bacterium]|nr:NAD(P)/FAD-dependent oxidoreductase [Candidatus Aminicenantes bacterium]